MTVITQDEPFSADAAAEKAKLQKHFGRSDIFFFLCCTIFGIDTVGTLASDGATVFTWLLLSMLVFALPSSLILAELGAAYTDEGGPYVWTRKAFGRLAGAVNNFFYWVTNPVWMGGTLVGTALGGWVAFAHDDVSFNSGVTYAFGLVFIWVGVLFAVLSFRVGKQIATIGAFARFALLGVFVVVIFGYGLRHGFHGPAVGDYAPTFSGFVALVPVILFSLVGFELPSAAGEEMKDAARDVPAGIKKSLVATGLMYGLPLLGILTVLPTSQASGLAGFPDAMRQALTIFGGHVSVASDGTVTSHLSGFGTAVGVVMAALITVVAFTSGLTWIMGSDRTLAVSCYDGAGPRWFGRFSERFGTPLRVNVLSGLVSTAVFVAATQITSGNAYKFFSVALGLAVSTTLISYLGILPAAWVLRRKEPDVERPFKAPLLPVSTVVTVGLLIFCCVQILFPGLGDHWFGPDYAWDGWKHSERWLFLLTELVPLVTFVAIAVTFWRLGRSDTEPTA